MSALDFPSLGLDLLSEFTLSDVWEMWEDALLRSILHFIRCMGDVGRCAVTIHSAVHQMCGRCGKMRCYDPFCTSSDVWEMWEDALL
jgi:hypothetical protein